MPLINVSASRPIPMWTVVRLLAIQPGPISVSLAKALLQPVSLPSAGGTEDTFDRAITTLVDLGLVVNSGDYLTLCTRLTDLNPNDSATFFDQLRAAVLEPERNTQIADDDNQSGPKDLVRALCWLLSLEPHRAVTGAEQDNGYFETLMKITIEAGHFSPNAGKPIVNSIRWNLFTSWAPALGFAASDVIHSDGRAERLIPDCTAAVHRTILNRWRRGTQMSIRQLVDSIRADLPVLPGGRYSRELGLPSNPNEVDPALSFALLCGHDQGWIKLDHRSDAASSLGVADPDQASGARRVSDVTVQGDANG